MTTHLPSPAQPPTGVRGLVSRRPTSSFFALAFGLSWLAWLPYVLSRQGLGVVDLSIPEVLGTPQLVGLLPGAYLGPDAFFPEVALTFRISDGTAHHHVPLLLSPFAYSTYRGS